MSKPEPTKHSITANIGVWCRIEYLYSPDGVDIDRMVPLPNQCIYTALTSDHWTSDLIDQMVLDAHMARLQDHPAGAIE